MHRSDAATYLAWVANVIKDALELKYLLNVSKKLHSVSTDAL
jgi:hypothetical protein